MNNRERILALFNGEKPDRVPWFGDLSYWALSLNENFVDRNYKINNKYYGFHEELNVGFYLQGYEPFKPYYDSEISIEILKENNVTKRIVKTPVGQICEKWEWLEKSFCEAPVKYFIKNASDLRVFKYWLEHTYYKPKYKEASKRYNLIGENGIVLCYLPKSPFMQLVTLFAGIETIVDLWMNYKKEFEEFLEAHKHKTNEAAQIALESPAESLMIPENLSSEIVGKNFYHSYIEDYHSEWTSKIKEANKYSFIHMDGTLKGLISEIGSVGFTVMEALTPSPVGDLSLKKIGEKISNETIFWGGIPGSYFTSIVSDDEFDRLVIETITFMKQKPKYVLGVSDQVPPNGLKERIERVGFLVEKYGYY